MPSLIIKEQSLALCSVCPNCSRHYDITSYEERNQVQVAIADFRKSPIDCERCGSPMEPGPEAQKFQDAMAAKEQNRFGPGVGRIETFRKISRKGTVLEGDDDSKDKSAKDEQ